MRAALRSLITGLLCACCACLAAAAPASANHKQVAIIEDDVHVLSDPMDTLQTFRSLGAQMVRVFVPWAQIAPYPFNSSEPSGFDATDPNAYPAGAWDRWDAVDRDAAQVGLKLDFVLTGGAPLWADGANIPSSAATNPNRAWFPNAGDFGQFVQAVGTRYSGTFPDPQNPGQTLPRISFWSLWNEPNFGEDLAPQATNGSTVATAPRMYRGLVAAAWNALGDTGHAHDRIIIGELAARGMSGKATHSHPQGLPGNFAQTKPLAFIRDLYCVGIHLQPLGGKSAETLGCPTSAAGRKSFRSQNPGLFESSGFSDHPYPQDLPPTEERSKDPDFVAFNEIPHLEHVLDSIANAYGSGKRFAIYNDEYGYITHPPNKGPYVNPSTAAYFLNWAEFLSYRASRIASTMQYLLYDPTPGPEVPGNGGFTSGLVFANGKRKATYNAYRMPLYLPNTNAAPGHALEVWGCVRPAPYAAADTGQAQYVQIQFQTHSRGAFKTISKVKIVSSRGYFDTRVKFPASGRVRLLWSYPSSDLLLPSGTINSRYVHVTVG